MGRSTPGSVRPILRTRSSPANLGRYLVCSFGLLDLADAKAAGIDYQGDPAILERIGAPATAR